MRSPSKDCSPAAFRAMRGWASHREIVARRPRYAQWPTTHPEFGTRLP
ncbi:MAG TPA: hypothetical protein VGB74_21500 [Actinoplanes sp.]|jgi:hypothetical protein